MKLQDWSLITNHKHAVLGRIWLMFDTRKVKVQICAMSSQLIHCFVDVNNSQFYWTTVYRSNDIEERKIMWNHIEALSKNMDISWLVQGDFNALMSDSEKLGGNDLNLNHRQEMTYCLDHSQLTELRSLGCFFTWTNL